MHGSAHPLCSNLMIDIFRFKSHHYRLEIYLIHAMFGAQEVSWICPPDCDNTSFLDDSPYWQADFTTFVKSSPINAHSVPNAVHLLLDKGMPKLVRASTQRTHRVPATTWGVGWRPYAFRRLLLSARYLLTVGGARHRMHMYYSSSRGTYSTGASIILRGHSHTPGRIN